VGEDLSPAATAPHVGEVLAAERCAVAVGEGGDDVGVMLVRVAREPLIPCDTIGVDRDSDPPTRGGVGGVRVAQRHGIVAVRGGSGGCGYGKERSREQRGGGDSHHAACPSVVTAAEGVVGASAAALRAVTASHVK
jgi:hypothetical protein